MTPSAQASSGKSFLREWGLLVGFGAGVIALFIGARFWLDHQADAPVEPRYAKYLNAVAAGSRAADEHLKRYYARYARTTVASRHFESMCGALTVLADNDGFDPEKVSVDMAMACRTYTRVRTTGQVPDL